MPDTKDTVRLTMAPMRAAVRAKSNRSGLSGWVSTLVWPGEARMAVKAERMPAMVQAIVEARRTHTPDSRAESAFSDMARMASPHGEYRMKTAKAAATIGATMRVSTAPGPKTKPPMTKDRWMGTGNGADRCLGRMKGKAVKT